MKIDVDMVQQELENENRLVPSCATPVKEGMVINTQSRKVMNTRVKVLNNLAKNPI